MKAVRAHKRGGPEVLRYEDAPVPEVGASEVLVEVHAAAVTPGELAWDETWLSADGADRTPVPSHEFSGVIARVGGDVSSLTPGTQVYGLIDFNHDGAAAEFVSLPQEAVVSRPVRLSHVESAALPLAALTAWQALSDRGPPAARRTSVHPGWRRRRGFPGGPACEGARRRPDGYRERRR
jgi:NADPH:quinone reductase-like Zn-dependent oxidoreductase